MLTPVIDRRRLEPVYMQIRNFIADEIHEGRLEKEERLPSVRSFAKYLNVSCTTIENAYNQLLAEGYINSSQGRGYFVETLETRTFRGSRNISEEDEKIPKAYRYDFAQEYIEPEAFDFNVWKRHLNRVINYNQNDLCGYGHNRGERVLREAIAKHFYRSRGVHATPGHIVVGGGVTPLLTMLGSLFRKVGIHHIALENPGFKKAYGVFGASEMTVSPLEITTDGILLDRLYESGARACYVSPSHHFPTGFIMPVSDRQRILKWAESVDGYVIEDDYNFELRFEGQPIPAMQGMDRGDRVIYLGSFSTVLAPAIRISFMVLPERLNRIFNESDAMFPQTASKVEQLALAGFMESGDFERHVKKVRNRYMKKQQRLIELLDRTLPFSFEALRVKSGLQILVKLPKGVSESAVTEACEKRSVHVEGLGKFFHEGEGNNEWPHAIVLSYRGINMADIPEAVEMIGNAVEEILSVRGLNDI